MKETNEKKEALKNKADELKKNGWIETSLGQYRSNGKIKDKTGYTLYIRERDLRTLNDDFSKKASFKASTNPCGEGVSGKGSNTTMGSPKSILTPMYDAGSNLPVLSSFSEYPSLKAIRSDSPCLSIAFDSEWAPFALDRWMLSWQFTVIVGGFLIEFVFLNDFCVGHDLPLELALGCILDYIQCFPSFDERKVRRYSYCASWDGDKPVVTTTRVLREAQSFDNFCYLPKEKKFVRRLIASMPDAEVNYKFRVWRWFYRWLDFKETGSIRINLICHVGKVDLSGLSYSDEKFLSRLSPVQNGVVSMMPIKLTPESLQHPNNKRVYPVLLSVSDTVCHAPSGKGKLKDLGEVIGVEKVDIPQETKSDMDKFLENDPCGFMEYASNDSVVTLLYASSLYGYNKDMPVTITSGACNVVKTILKDYFNCESEAEFNYVYRGVRRVFHGKFKNYSRAVFMEASSLEAVSMKAGLVQMFASSAYHGGYNSCSEVGYFPQKTFDYDQKNAYPVGMCLVPDIDWCFPIKSEINDRCLRLDDFFVDGKMNPFHPFVAYVTFEFPADCKFPCIPIVDDGIPVYPLSSGGEGVYVAGPFIWLALTLGARVYCEKGFVLNVLRVKGKVSYSLSAVVKQLVVDRSKAQRAYGKGCLEEQILKTMVNSIYGKVAQNVIEKRLWDCFHESSVPLGCSAITNPVSAMMITSIVQVLLIAAQNQCFNLGYMTCSVTTDGFISDCPEEVLKGLDLYGLRPLVEEARVFLSGDKDLWEIKHKQDDLVNFTTRGNVSLHCAERDGYNGVCAHNSVKSEYPEDSYEDRFWLMTQVLGRTGRVPYAKEVWTRYKDIARGYSFTIMDSIYHQSMDFDMKRKPSPDSFKNDHVVVEGVTYDIAHFDTVPFNNIEEYRRYREKKDCVEVLRTLEDWEKFWVKLSLKGSKAKPRNLEWSILLSIIMGYRNNEWVIPGLEDKTVAEKIAWINEHNHTGKTFKLSDWKNARRPERQANMLPREFYDDKLREFMNAQP